MGLIDQIKGADYWSPNVYKLLTYYHALQLTLDPLNGQHIPLSGNGVQRPLLMAFGILTPAVYPSGNVLDRSTSIQSNTQTRAEAEDSEFLVQNQYQSNSSNPQNPDGSHPNTVSSNNDDGVQTSGTPQASTTEQRTGTNSTTASLQDDEYWDNYLAMCNRLGCDPEDLALVIQSESGWKPNAVNGSSNAKGLFQLTRTTALGLGMSESQWTDYQNSSPSEQLVWMEKYYTNQRSGKSRVSGSSAGEIKAITLGGYKNPNGSLYDGNASSKGYQEGSRQENAYEKNKSLDVAGKGYIDTKDLDRVTYRVRLPNDIRANIEKAQQRAGQTQTTGQTSQTKPVEQDSSVSTDFVDSGSTAAQQASNTTAQLSGTDTRQRLLGTDIGQRFQAAQINEIAAIQSAIDDLASTPPLRLLVNPNSFSIEHTKLINGGEWGRNGPIVEHWGDGQDMVNASGKLLAFFSMTADNAMTPGLSRTSRQFSKSYQNLLSLWAIYKNNGGIHIQDPIVGDGKTMNLSLLGSCYMWYDDQLYIGSFDSMELTEAADQPFTMEYNFSFTVRFSYRFA